MIGPSLVTKTQFIRRKVMVSNEQPTYLSYLLRLWREEHGGHFIWRASVETPGLDKRLAFADLAALFAFLAAQTSAGAPGSAPAETSE